MNRKAKTTSSKARRACRQFYSRIKRQRGHESYQLQATPIISQWLSIGIFGSNELARALSYRSNEVAAPNVSYTSERDGKSYNVLSGYGQENTGNMRGNTDNRDVYSVFKLRFSIILGKN